MKRLFALLIALALCLTMTAFAEAEHEEVTLTLGSIWSADSEANKAPFQQTLAEFAEAYPWIHVEVDWNEANAWKDKGETLAQDDALPDVFYWNAGGILHALVDQGDIMPLDDFLDEETKSRIIEGTLTDMTFDGHIYQLPYTLACSVMYVNVALFEENDIKIPETWDELIEAVKAFRALGITPMAVGGGDRWPTNMYMDIINLRFAGDEQCRAAFYKTEGGTFMTDEWIESANAFQQLVELGAFPEDAAALTRDESEVPFYNGEIPMYVNGQWTAANCDPEKVIAVKFPIVPDRGTDNAWMGGAAEGFCVASYTEHPEEAFLLCQFCAENLSKNGYIAGAGLPAWKADFTGYEISPITAQIVELTSTADSFLLWGNTALEGEDSELLMDTLLMLLRSDITGEEFCETMESIF